MQKMIFSLFLMIESHLNLHFLSQKTLQLFAHSSLIHSTQQNQTVILRKCNVVLNYHCSLEVNNFPLITINSSGSRLPALEPNVILQTIITTSVNVFTLICISPGKTKQRSSLYLLNKIWVKICDVWILLCRSNEIWFCLWTLYISSVFRN